MPDLRYSELANWNASRSSAPGDINELNRDQIPSGSQHPSRFSPLDIHTTTAGTLHTPAPLSSTSASVLITGVAAMDIPGSPEGVEERPRAMVLEATTNADASALNGESPSAPPSSSQAITARVNTSVGYSMPSSRVETRLVQSSPSLPQPPPGPSRKPPSKTAHPPRRPSQSDSGGLTRPSAAVDDEDTNSLMDADGETDDESSVSVYPIQSIPGSSSSTANVSRSHQR